MSHPFVPRVGGVVSADVAVPEHEREVRFYSQVLGTGETPLWREDLMNNQGLPVIGLGPRSEEYAHIPVQWMPHIQVADVAASVERALAHGGSELMHAKGDDGASQWAVLVDPDGVAFGIIPVVPAEACPAEVSTPVGCIAGIELTVADASATCEFYRQVVGWSVQDVEMEHAGERWVDHVLLGEDGNPAGRIRHARGANEGLPPVWLLRLPVGDLAESLRRVREGGGEVLVERQAADGEQASAVIRDPVGLSFALVAG